MERHWFTRVEFDGYSSSIVTQQCSQRNSIHAQCRTRIDTCFSLFTFQCTLVSYHTRFIQTTSRCVICVLWQSQHSSDHWINTSPFTLKSDTMSRRFHRSLVQITSCPSKRNVTNEIRTGQSDLGFSSLMDGTMLTWIEAATFCWLTLSQFICINDLPRLLNSVTVGHLFVKYCRVSSNELLFSKRRDKSQYCLFCET